MTKKKVIEAGDLRCYAFAHKLLLPVQKGLQVAHALVDLGFKYERSSPQGEMFAKWAQHHKTLIVLDGGFSGQLKKTVESMKRSPLAWCEFHEDEYTFEGARTAAVIIVDMSHMERVMGGVFDNPNDIGCLPIYRVISEAKLAQ